MNKKGLVLLVALCVMITPNLFAALAAYDGFTYPENSDLDGQSGGIGWDGSWDGSPAHGSSVASPGLQYEDLITGMNSMRLSWPAESSLLPERELGVSRGSVIEIDTPGPFGDPVKVKVKGYHLSLRLDEAACIEVQTL